MADLSIGIKWKIHAFFTLIVLLLGCAKSNDVESVEIAPSLYRTGAIRSRLATPIVDEVIRLNKNKIHILACPATPPQNIIQFQNELASRRKVEVILSLSSDSCVVD